MAEQEGYAAAQTHRFELERLLKTELVGNIKIGQVRRDPAPYGYRNRLQSRVPSYTGYINILMEVLTLTGSLIWHNNSI